ncbi:unnamed protein product [Adineta steineri]|uniref:Uncharacterized protein n=1 Tax=Adineta steineri TaxID=433720 RepID=A0A815SYP6_9BILA|nr:unnamed protein product [Adineta steineri]CAF3884944.1 unnamed protein product [Adineta steineri]
MNQDEINTNKDSLWKFIENASNNTIDRKDSETWSKEWASFSTHGVISGLGIGQSDFLWNARSNRQIKKVFTCVWNNQQLLTSFDGCGVFRDWRYNSAWKTTGGCNHVDQNPETKPHRCCIQGLLSLTDQNETTGGLVVYPQTHSHFKQLSDVVKNNNDYVTVSNIHPIMNQGKTLVHCNSPATTIEERNKNEPVDLLRIVAYVSMSSITLINAQTIFDEFRGKRKEMVENNCKLTHWSTEFVVGGGGNNTDTDLSKLSLDKFNVHQKALIFSFDDENNE